MNQPSRRAPPSPHFTRRTVDWKFVSTIRPLDLYTARPLYGVVAIYTVSYSPENIRFGSIRW